MRRVLPERLLARTPLLFSATLAFFLLCAALARASNMGFEITIPILRSESLGGTGKCTYCETWISLPTKNKYVGKTLVDICASNPSFRYVGQPGSLGGRRTKVKVLDPTQIDSLVLVTCGLVRGNVAYQPGLALLAALKLTTGADLPLEIVGVHDPSTGILIRNRTSSGGTGNCTVCYNWVNLPYHTKAAKLSDVCSENAAFGVISQVGSATLQPDGSTLLDRSSIDTLATRDCSLPSGSGLDPEVQVGRAVGIKLKTNFTGDVTWFPKHF